MIIHPANNNVFQNYCRCNKFKIFLLRNILNNKGMTRMHKFSTFASLTSKRLFTKNKTCSNFAYLQQKKWFSDKKDNSPSNKLPSLMPNFPKIMWPSVIKSIRNFVLTTLIIKPYLDRDFNLPDFVSGSKKALEVISRKLAEGDIKSLEGLVTNEIIPSLKETISSMSLSQREELAVNIDDIYFSFPYQIGVMFNDEEGKQQKRYVEITMIYHSLKGLSQMRSLGDEPPINMGMLPEYQHKIFICNYRFIREFTKGVDGDWTVNLLNHFKPADENHKS